MSDETTDEALMARAFACAFTASVYRPVIIEKTHGTGDLLVTVAFRIRGGAEAPEALMAARAGALFQMAAVQLDAMGGPKAPSDDWGLKAIKLSHAICRKTEFLIWCCDQLKEDPAMMDIREMKAAARKVIHDAIHAACGVRSRSALRKSPPARAALYDLVNRFHQSQNKTGWLGMEREGT